MKHVTILIRHGQVGLIKVDGNWTGAFHPNENLAVAFEKDSEATAIKEYKKAVQDSQEKGWELSWQGEPSYG